MKMLGLLEPEHYPDFSDVPTLAETLPGFTKAASWFALFGPPGLPRPIVTRLNSETVRALQHKDVRAKLDEQGIQPLGGTPEQLAAQLKSDIEKSGTLIRSLGITPE